MTEPDSAPVLLGIRHHGPGSARMVKRALEQTRPALILIEGPPEADALLDHVHALTPPVAILLHAETEPENAAFWPFAEFSPEWQALRYAAENGVQARFFDLPAAASIGDDGPSGNVDPIGLLAEAAGFDDPERWWEDVVEHSASDPLDLADAIAEAMVAVRKEFEGEVGERTLRREAFMRQTIRKARKETDGPIVVVCGAWKSSASRGASRTAPTRSAPSPRSGSCAGTRSSRSPWPSPPTPHC